MGHFEFFLQVISANAPSFPGVGFTLSSASGSGVVYRRNYSRDFQFPLRINVKISEHAPNFNVFKPRLVCGRIFNLALGSSGNSQKSEILKNLKFSKI